MRAKDVRFEAKEPADNYWQGGDGAVLILELIVNKHIGHMMALKTKPFGGHTGRLRSGITSRQAVRIVMFVRHVVDIWARCCMILWVAFMSQDRAKHIPLLNS